MDDYYGLISKYIETTACLMRPSSRYDLVEDVLDVSAVVCDRLLSGGKVVAFGNGGSAADAQHFVGELVGRFKLERGPIRAICLNDNVAVMTAVSNDYGYGFVFSRQVAAIVDPGDVSIGISTSGKSLSVIDALEQSKERGAYTILLTGGFYANTPFDFIDRVVKVKTDDTSIIQNIHIVILHAVAMVVEDKIHKVRGING